MPLLVDAVGNNGVSIMLNTWMSLSFGGYMLHI